MTTARSPQTTSIYQVVADMQESMEGHGLTTEVVDAIVSKGLQVLFGLSDGFPQPGQLTLVDR